MRLTLLLVLLVLPLSAQSAQSALRPRTTTEFTLGTRLGRSGEEASPFAYDDGRAMMAIGLGRVTPIGTRTSAGGVIALGVQDGLGYIALGPRLRYHASPVTTLDVTTSVMITRNEEIAGPLLVDAAVMHKDRVGLVIQAAAGHREIWTTSGEGKRVSSASVAAGLRLGGKPGRIGGGVAILTVATALIVILTSWSD